MLGCVCVCVRPSIGRRYSLRVADGAVEWTHTLPSAVFASPTDRPLNAAAPAIIKQKRKRSLRRASFDARRANHCALGPHGISFLTRSKCRVHTWCILFRDCLRCSSAVHCSSPRAARTARSSFSLHQAPSLLGAHALSPLCLQPRYRPNRLICICEYTRYQFGAEVFSSPVACAPGCLVIGCRDDHVYCVHVEIPRKMAVGTRNGSK